MLLYQIVSEDDNSKTQYENLNFAVSWGFNVSNSFKLCKNIDEVYDTLTFGKIKETD